MKLIPVDVEHTLNVEPRVEAPGRRMGQLLIESGKLIAEDADRILEIQQREGLRFGDAAKKLGLLTEDDIQRALAQQFEYTYLRPGEGGFAPELIAAYQPFTPQVEALRAVRTQLLVRWFNTDAKRRSLAVVSPRRKEGRTYVAANLAVVFSQLGERTLLIDADLRNPRQHEILGVENRVGLSTILSGRAGTDAVQQLPVFLDLSVLTAGPVPPNPQELLERVTFQRLMREAMEHYDVVIIDTPAGGLTADAQTITAVARGALIVTRQNATKVQDARRLANQIADCGAQTVGAIINDF
jgi:protein-tyrosine kinase